MVNVAVLCPSEIAHRRFMPALAQQDDFKFIGIGINSVAERYGDSIPSELIIQQMLSAERSKAEEFISEYGGILFNSYEEVVSSELIDAVYIPLPPALHYKWARKALEKGKHVLVEKPATTRFSDTKELIEYSRKMNLALHENYMFVFHKQLDSIDEIVRNGDIGEIRLFRISFGFPMRSAKDFRYDKKLGGGALIDAGGYTIRYASRLLGDTARIKCANLNYHNGFNVDMYGSGTLVNSDGVTAQISFGMDNDYKCELEVWGSKGTLKTGRVLTAPAGYVPTATISKNGIITEIDLPADDAFLHSIDHFTKCISSDKAREMNYQRILRQAELVEEFALLANNG